MEYKGYYIDCDLFKGVYTVCYNGDEIAFPTIKEAEEFIDELEE